MYNNYMLDNLTRQKEKLEEMIRNYQQPINNIITTTPQSNKDLIEWRILNETEEVDNLYVSTKTLFINDNMMVLKGVDGSLEKWEIKKIYPIDKKDEKISMLENEIRELKEMIGNEYTKSDEPIRNSDQSNGTFNVNVDTKSKTTSRSIQKQEQRRTMSANS